MLIRIKQGFRKLKFSLDLRHELAADTLKNQTKNNHQMIAIEQLKEVGKIWLAWVRLQDHDPAEVTQIFEKLKGELDVKLGRGWQKYDPVIKKGRPQSYKKLFQELDSDSQESANALIKYFNEGIPEDAPVSPVIHLILILCVCEVGRGYGQAPDNMLEALQGASIDEEHCAIMSVVVQKVQSAKNRLTEACTSLLTGFEVSKESVNNSTA